MRDPLKKRTSDIATYAIQRWVVPRTRTSLEQWFYEALVLQVHSPQASTWSSHPRYFEFGVGQGGTLMAYVQALIRFCKKYQFDLSRFEIYGFDSFRGLPDKASHKDDHRDWEKGALNYPTDIVLSRIATTKLPPEQVTLVEGFFSDSLTEELREKLSHQPPAIITVDCDYYSSTMTVLEWLSAFLPSGTLFYFDDIWSFHGNPEHGELAAIHDFNANGNGFLTPWPLLGLASNIYMFSRSPYEQVNETA